MSAAAETVGFEEIEALADEIATFAARIDAATHAMLTKLRRFDEVEGYGSFGATSTAHWLSWRTGMDPGTARERVRVARALGSLPLVDAAMRKGELSYARVRAITRVATPKTDGDFLELALHSTASQLEKLCRAYRSTYKKDREGLADRRRWVRRQQTRDGMVRLSVQLPAEEAAIVWEAMMQAMEPPPKEQRDVSAETPAAASRSGEADADNDASATAQSPSSPGVSAETSLPPDPPANDPVGLEERRADGLIAVAESYVQQKGGTIGSGFELLLMATRKTLGTEEPEGIGGYLPDGLFVSSSTARRIACHASMVLVEKNERGDVLDVGRKTRTIPPAIRRALWIRDGGCCRFPGCTRKRHLDGHHIWHWVDGGPTCLDNLVLLCREHHGMVHDGRISVQVHGGEIRFFDHRGERLPDAPPPAATGADLEELEAFLRDADLHIDERTNEPRWNGDHLDLDSALLFLQPPESTGVH